MRLAICCRETRLRCGHSATASERGRGRGRATAPWLALTSGFCGVRLNIDITVGIGPRAPKLEPPCNGGSDQALIGRSCDRAGCFRSKVSEYEHQIRPAKI